MQLIDFKVCGDHRGSLISLEGGNNIPFEIKRVYYIFATKDGVARGFHAHKNLQQVVVAVNGSCEFHIDEGNGKTIVHLNGPERGVLLDMVSWREMHNFSSDCVLMVLASAVYDKDDYITDYDEFKRITNAKTRGI